MEGACGTLTKVSVTDRKRLLDGQWNSVIPSDLESQSGLLDAGWNCWELCKSVDRFQIKPRAPLFFMHIPKTAGMSMRSYLSDQYDPQDICPFVRWHGILGREQTLSSFRLVQGHFRYNIRPLLAENARILVMLREPLRRTVSALLHLQRDPSFHPDHHLTKGFSVSEMLRHSGLMGNQRNIQARFLCASVSPNRVSSYLKRELSQNTNVDASDLEEPPDLDLAIQRLESIDFVGLTEDIGAVVTPMAQDLSYHPPLYFPFINENPTHRDDPLEGLTEEDLGILEEYNDIDLKIYGFAKRLIERRAFGRDMRRLVDSGVYVVPRGSFEIPIHGIMPGSGWYAPDEEKGVFWRWTGPSRHFTIEVPLRNDTSYRLTLLFGNTCPLPDDIVADVNCVPIALEPAGDDRRRLALIIPARLLAQNQGFCRVRLRGPKPVQLSASDVRMLGVAVGQIMFECLDG
jgi:hypothetical protein